MDRSCTSGGARRPLSQGPYSRVDRQGREESIKAPPRGYTYPRLSPDGTHLALDVRDQEGDIWIWDFGQATLRRLTFDPSNDQYPVWTPDSQHIVFESGRAGSQNLFWQPANGGAAAERLTESVNGQLPYLFSPDGTRLVFREDNPKTGPDLKMLTMSGERRTNPLVHAEANEVNAEISPDGHWIVYQSNESGRDEVYVRSFPEVEKGRWQISTGGGAQPTWARNGKELFYIGSDGRLMAAGVRADQTFAFTAPRGVPERRVLFGSHWTELRRVSGWSALPHDQGWRH